MNATTRTLSAHSEGEEACRPRGERKTGAGAVALDHEDVVPVTAEADRGSTNYLWSDERWCLYLQGVDDEEERHLFRVDLAAPGDPAVDLTPLPPGSRVSTVDPLATLPGTVLVSMNQRQGHVDYFLIDVATGQTTEQLPASPRR